MGTSTENKSGTNEEKRLKEWMRAQETASLGVEIRDVSVSGNSVNIEAWVKSSSKEGKKYGVLLPLERKENSKNKHAIRMDKAIHECDDIKFNYAEVCRHIRAVAIYVKEHFREIKKEYGLKGVNLK